MTAKKENAAHHHDAYPAMFSEVSYLDSFLKKQLFLSCCSSTTELLTSTSWIIRRWVGISRLFAVVIGSVGASARAFRDPRQLAVPQCRECRHHLVVWQYCNKIWTRLWCLSWVALLFFTYIVKSTFVQLLFRPWSMIDSIGYWAKFQKGFRRARRRRRAREGGTSLTLSILYWCAKSPK